MTIDWVDPIKCAEAINQQSPKEWIFLHSSLVKKNHSNFSIIAFDKKRYVSGDDLHELKKSPIFNKKKNLQKLEDIVTDAWFGFISYNPGLIEKKPPIIDCPGYYFCEFHHVIVFSNSEKKVYFNSGVTKKKLNKYLRNIYENFGDEKNANYFDKPSSNFTDSSYKSAVEEIKNKIENGEFYEANLTRKFYGKCKVTASFQIFKELTLENKLSHACYGVLNGVEIISLSPELFLQFRGGKVISRPIKGTEPILPDGSDRQEAEAKLKESEKDKSENLMIVDLTRNDLSKSAIPGSVKVNKMFHVEHYQNVVHLVSEIEGRISKEKNFLDVVIDSFPPGSMTGAPKTYVMDVCNQLEKYPRGLYSGSIGYLHPDASELSVVIRTLFVKNGVYEFQVGGAIVYDSDANLELEEIYSKAKPFRNFLSLR